MVRLPNTEMIPVRIAISPYYTLVASIYEVVRGQSRGSPQTRHRYVRGRVQDLDLSPFDVFVPSVPDFLADHHGTPRATIAEELQRLRRTDLDRVRREINDEYGADIPSAMRPFLRDPRGVLDRLVDALERFWERVMEPLWPSMEALLEREVLRVGSALATEGPHALLARISHRIVLKDGELRWMTELPHVQGMREDLSGKRLVLLPMCSGPDSLWFSYRRESEVMIGYAVPGVGLLWEETAEAGTDPLADLLGETRARVMRAAHTPATTADVANQLNLSSALVSHHLRALRTLGLVDGSRFGRRVYYRVTSRGRNVWSAIETDAASG